MVVLEGGRHSFQKLLFVNRLGQKCVSTHVGGLSDDLVGFHAGNDDDHRARLFFVRPPQPIGHSKAVPRIIRRMHRQIDIEGYEVGIFGAGNLNGGSGILGYKNLVAGGFENAAEELLGDLVVFHHEYLFSFHAAGTFVTAAAMCVGGTIGVKDQKNGCNPDEPV